MGRVLLLLVLCCLASARPTHRNILHEISNTDSHRMIQERLNRLMRDFDEVHTNSEDGQVDESSQPRTSSAVLDEAGAVLNESTAVTDRVEQMLVRLQESQRNWESQRSVKPKQPSTTNEVTEVLDSIGLRDSTEGLIDTLLALTETGVDVSKPYLIAADCGSSGTKWMVYGLPGTCPAMSNPDAADGEWPERTCADYKSTPNMALVPDERYDEYVSVVDSLLDPRRAQGVQGIDLGKIAGYIAFATAGNRIISEELDRTKFASLDQAVSRFRPISYGPLLYKDVPPQCVPGTNEAWYEFKTLSDLLPGGVNPNFVSLGGASSQWAAVFETPDAIHAWLALLHPDALPIPDCNNQKNALGHFNCVVRRDEAAYRPLSRDEIVAECLPNPSACVALGSFLAGYADPQAPSMIVGCGVSPGDSYDVMEYGMTTDEAISDYESTEGVAPDDAELSDKVKWCQRVEGCHRAGGTDQGGKWWLDYLSKMDPAAGVAIKEACGLTPRASDGMLAMDCGPCIGYLLTFLSTDVQMLATRIFITDYISEGAPFFRMGNMAGAVLPHKNCAGNPDEPPEDVSCDCGAVQNKPPNRSTFFGLWARAYHLAMGLAPDRVVFVPNNPKVDWIVKAAYMLGFTDLCNMNAPTNPDEEINKCAWALDMSDSSYVPTSVIPLDASLSDLATDTPASEEILTSRQQMSFIRDINGWEFDTFPAGPLKERYVVAMDNLLQVLVRHVNPDSTRDDDPNQSLPVTCRQLILDKLMPLVRGSVYVNSNILFKIMGTIMLAAKPSQPPTRTQDFHYHVISAYDFQPPPYTRFSSKRKAEELKAKFKVRLQNWFFRFFGHPSEVTEDGTPRPLAFDEFLATTPDMVKVYETYSIINSDCPFRKPTGDKKRCLDMIRNTLFRKSCLSDPEKYVMMVGMLQFITSDSRKLPASLKPFLAPPGSGASGSSSASSAISASKQTKGGSKDGGAAGRAKDVKGGGRSKDGVVSSRPASKLKPERARVSKGGGGMMSSSSHPPGGIDARRRVK